MTDFDLKVDSETGQLYAEDPETGDRQPVPFDEIDVNNAGVESLNAEEVDSEQYLENGEPLDLDAGFPVEGDSIIMEEAEDDRLSISQITE